VGSKGRHQLSLSAIVATTASDGHRDVGNGIWWTVTGTVTVVGRVCVVERAISAGTKKRGSTTSPHLPAIRVVVVVFDVDVVVHGPSLVLPSSERHYSVCLSYAGYRHRTCSDHGGVWCALLVTGHWFGIRFAFVSLWGNGLSQCLSTWWSLLCLRVSRSFVCLCVSHSLLLVLLFVPSGRRVVVCYQQ
jgi:hypothetical protein